jgi:hypothetical protein
MKGDIMKFEQKAKIRIEHWIKHAADHLKEYERFAEELEKEGNQDSARHIREMAVLTAKSTDCLDSALLSLGKATETTGSTKSSRFGNRSQADTRSSTKPKTVLSHSACK